MELPNHRRRVRTRIEPRRNPSHLLPYGLDFCGAREGGEQHFATPHRLCSGSLLVGKSLDLAQVVDLQLVAGALQVGSHVAPHGAEADEADPHIFSSANTCFATSAALPAL